MAEHICGHTIVGAGVEWICVLPPHDKIYMRHTKGRRGEVIFSNNPSVNRHYMVNRWPNRSKETDPYGNESSEEGSKRS